MVIGNGLIAKRFYSYENDPEILIFASGVSNSKNKNEALFGREVELLQNTIDKYPNLKLVYFSTCSMHDPGEANSPYTLHKLQLEDLIQRRANQFNIFRVSQIVGKATNPNTVLNFFYYHIVNQINFDLWVNAYRNLIDMDDAYLIIDKILKSGMYGNQVIEVANPTSYKVTDIVAALEEVTGQSACAIPIEKGYHFDIDISLILPVIKELKIDFDQSYLHNLVRKYYQHS
jgi:nucleoside-diphosphate-sugar epimerase